MPTKKGFTRASLLLWSCFMLGLPAWAQTPNFTTDSSVEINLKSEKAEYSLTSNEWSSRYNTPLRRMEFSLPLQSVCPQKQPSDLLPFEALFLPEADSLSPPDNRFQLFVDMPVDMRNFDYFRTVQSITLSGKCMVGQRMYYVPVRMSFFYSENGPLRYELEMAILPNTKSDAFTPSLPNPQWNAIEFTVAKGKMALVFNE